MIERIIENWLINSKERIYQIPYCQVLGLKHYKILHLSSHGVSEHGKDIISLDPNGKPCCFQLKTGNINASEWRKIFGEITELIEIPIEYPLINNELSHRAVLVTNGKVTDDVRIKITSLNRGYLGRKLPQLELITGKELLRDFLEAQGSFLPSEPSQIQDFLKLYLNDGKGNIDERAYANYIEGILFTDSENLTKKDYFRKIASSLLLTKYSIRAFENNNNYVSVVKAFTILNSYILSLVQKRKISKKYWHGTFSLIKTEIFNNLESLNEEVRNRNNMLEGNLIGDGEMLYKVRSTIVLGWCSAFELIKKKQDNNYTFDKKIYDLIIDNKLKNNLFLTGESEIIYFIMMALYLSSYGDKKNSHDIYATILYTVLFSNNFDSKIDSLPDPYHNSEEVMLSLLFLSKTPIDFSVFKGKSYTIKTIIDCIVRENRRDILEQLWYLASKTQYIEFTPKEIWGYSFWRFKDGVNNITAFDSPQSWNELLKEANSNNSIPRYLAQDPIFPFLFLLTYPHRLTSSTIKLIDHNFENS